MFALQTIAKRNLASRVSVILTPRRLYCERPQEALQENQENQQSQINFGELVKQNRQLIEEINSLKSLVNKQTELINNPEPGLADSFVGGMIIIMAIGVFGPIAWDIVKWFCRTIRDSINSVFDDLKTNQIAE